ncbi:Tim17/Tim22/Tim23/Pmp24 family-domain-containing protein [Phanerochaete sordida]|uniref:Tim17/Tim22/Tim23/Pmp24 family-domain-containing protein n=1 Tax=Phanerochaete sordida TaxID=48140 RepID=A0A9P3LA05_9APHY|nr:Tim17/Tim22/Tim23/Pmp24 family-domain-containing protein [Phanerochaete sordida]
MAEAHQLHSSTPAEPDTTYEERPSLRYAAAVGLQGAGIGAVVSAVQNALGTHSKGAAGFFTRTGGTIGIFAAMGATYALTEAAVANQRQKEDSLNTVAGGCAAGFLAGIRSHSIPAAVASCAVLGAAVGAAEYGGRKIAGSTEDSKEERRKRFFKQPKPSPAAQTEE